MSALPLFWRACGHRHPKQPNIARLLDDSIRRQLKEGATEPVFIASEALKDVDEET